jgi:cellulose biosynthesis protein BcsQ
MKTVSVISHKGGAGKTTSAVMLAEDLAGRGFQVLLVDADRQQSAGLLLGLDGAPETVLPTPVPRLRYLSCKGLSLAELPARAAELDARFDVAVVDTPSLDDPLAGAWVCLSTAALLVLPVEPLGMWTLTGAETTLGKLRGEAPGPDLIGILPTLYDESHAGQRALLDELRAARGSQLLPLPVRWDADLAQRAAADSAGRPEPSEATRAAYHAAGEAVVSALKLEPQPERGPAPASPTRTIAWAIAIAVAVIVAACLGVGLLHAPR